MKGVLESLAESLKPEGFRLRRSTFVRDTGQVLQLIGIQRSSSSTASYLRVTVNIGLHAKALMRPEARAPSSTADCQAQFRLSQILPGPHEDRWWGITDEAEARLAVDDMRSRITGYALPVLEGLRTTEDILREWSDGGNRRVAPGPEFDRLRFVQALRDLSGTS